MRVLVKHWSDGDWIEVESNNGIEWEEEWANHEVPNFVWIDLLRKAGVRVEEQEIAECFYCQERTVLPREGTGYGLPEGWGDNGRGEWHCPDCPQDGEDY